MNRQKLIDINRAHLDGANSLEGVLCLAALIAAEILNPDSEIYDAEEKYLEYGEWLNCPLVERCLACIINE